MAALVLAVLAVDCAAFAADCAAFAADCAVAALDLAALAVPLAVPARPSASLHAPQAVADAAMRQYSLPAIFADCFGQPPEESVHGTVVSRTAKPSPDKPITEAVLNSVTTCLG